MLKTDLNPTTRTFPRTLEEAFPQWEKTPPIVGFRSIKKLELFSLWINGFSVGVFFALWVFK
jgi:hypothetical protein